MKAHITRGKSFGGLSRYLEHDGGEIIGGSMVNTIPRELAKEFRAVSNQREDIEKPVWHSSLSLPPGDTLSDEEWQSVAADYLKRMEIDPEKYQWSLVRHYDKAHEHVHIVCNRVSLDADVWLGQNDVFKAITVCREIEKEYEILRDTTDRDYSDRSFRPTQREKAYENRTELPSIRSIIHGHIQRVLEDARQAGQKLTLQEFVREVRMSAALGIEVMANTANDGQRCNGLSFRWLGDKSSYRGSQVGVKWKELIEEIDYDSMRDASYLRSLDKSKTQLLQDETFAKKSEPVLEDEPEFDRDKKEEKETDEKTKTEIETHILDDRSSIDDDFFDWEMESMKKAIENVKKDRNKMTILECSADIRETGPDDLDLEQAAIWWNEIDYGRDKDPDHLEYVEAVYRWVYDHPQDFERTEVIPYTFAYKYCLNDLDYSPDMGI